ncbi:MAG: FG-GAP repeat protein, partial [Blastocatellia bacterium]
LPPAYHAPNPEQRLDAYFTPEGLHLTPRAPERAEISPFDQLADGVEERPRMSGPAHWRAAMRMIGHGYGDALLPAAFPELVAKGNRLEYRRSGITEWYINTARGLEQGFTLADAPGSRAPGERLRFELELSGDLRAELIEEGRALALKRADGVAALRYSDLYAYDAQGRTLPSLMRLSNGQVWLEVDDKEAVYPVTIDPLFTFEKQLWVNDGSQYDLFGYSVAVDGDTAVVGAPDDDISVNGVVNGDQGSAYVFVRSGTAWNLQQKLVAIDGAYSDRFGWSVAISFNTVVVGAPDDDYQLGSVYVFVRSGTAWNPDTKLLGRGRRFGHSVSISANRLVVGSPKEVIDSKVFQGAAYVFTRANSIWGSQPLKLIADDGMANDFFGFSVAISGDKIVVGAPWEDELHVDQGSAYVFEFNSPNQTWIQRPKLVAHDAAANDHFGYAVAINGVDLIVGAPDDDVGAKSDQGSAYVFHRNSSTWSERQQLFADNGAASDRFGSSVAIAGVTAVVGAPNDDNGANTDQGSAYIFTFNGSFWNVIPQRLIASDGKAMDIFGWSVAIDRWGATVLVGAPRGDVFSFPFGFLPDRGTAYVYAAN